MATSLARKSTSTTDRVVILGRSLLGTSIAYHLLARQGFTNVLLVDKKGGSATGSSGSSSGASRGIAWVNSYRSPYSRHRLMRLNLGHLHNLERQVGGNLPLVEWTKSFHVARAAEAEGYARQRREEYQRFGGCIQRVDKEEVKKVEPRLKLKEVSSIDCSEDGGIVDTSEFEKLLLRHSEQRGLTQMTAAVTGIYPEGSHWKLALTGVIPPSTTSTTVTTSGSELTCDRVIIASSSAPPLLHSPALGFPLSTTLPTLTTTQIYLTPLPRRILRSVVHVVGDMTIVQSSSGETCLTIHHTSRHPDASDQESWVSSAVARATQLLPDLRITQVDRVVRRKQNVAGDGNPVVGWLAKSPAAYWAVSSVDRENVDFVLGEWIASEIAMAGGGEVVPLQPFRPSRLPQPHPSSWL